MTGRWLLGTVSYRKTSRAKAQKKAFKQNWHVLCNVSSLVSVDGRPEIAGYLPTGRLMNMSPGKIWMIMRDGDLLTLKTDLALTALDRLSLNPAAEACLKNCPPDNQPHSMQPDQPHAAWNAQHVQTPP